MPAKKNDKNQPPEGQDLSSLENSGFFTAPASSSRSPQQSTIHDSSQTLSKPDTSNDSEFGPGRNSFLSSQPEVLNLKSASSEQPSPRSAPQLQVKKKKSAHLKVKVIPIKSTESISTSPSTSPRAYTHNGGLASPYSSTRPPLPPSPLSAMTSRSISDEIDDTSPRNSDLPPSRPRTLTASSMSPSILDSPAVPPIPSNPSNPSNANSNRPSLASSMYKPERGGLSSREASIHLPKEPPLPWMENHEARVSVKSFKSTKTNASAMTYDSSIPPDTSTSETDRSSVTSSYEVLPKPETEEFQILPKIENKITKELTVEDFIDMYYEFDDDKSSVYKDFYTDSGTTLEEDRQVLYKSASPVTPESPKTPITVPYKDLTDLPIHPMLDASDSLEHLKINTSALESPISPMLGTPNTGRLESTPSTPYSPLRQNPVNPHPQSHPLQEHDMPELRDRYGFKKSNRDITIEQYQAWNFQYSEYLERRRNKWDQLMSTYGIDTDTPTIFPPKSDKVKRYIRKGIPPEWRGEAWFWYSGGPDFLKKHPGLYQDLVVKVSQGHLSESDQDMIERDLHRTFPDCIKFKPDHNELQIKPSTPSGLDYSSHQSQSQTQPETSIVKALRRVLQAFALHNPAIGYCQSLNFLAGLLLLMLNENEEKAFVLLKVLTSTHFPGIHAKILEANVDIGVFMSFIQESMPAIWAKINDVDEPATNSRNRSAPLGNRLPTVNLALTPWFMSLFIISLPIETTLRVWDILFYEGAKTIFRVGLTLFKLGETTIKNIKDPLEVFQVVQALPRRQLDPNILIEATFKRRGGFASISAESIEQRRAQRRMVARQEQKQDLQQKKIGRDRGHTFVVPTTKSNNDNNDNNNTTNKVKGDRVVTTPITPTIPIPPIPKDNDSSNFADFMASRPSMDQRMTPTRQDTGELSERRGRMMSFAKRVRGTSRSRRRKEKSNERQE